MCALQGIAGLSLSHPRNGSSLERSAAFSAASFMNCFDPVGCKVYSLISRTPNPCCCCCWLLLLLNACTSSGSAALLGLQGECAPSSSRGQPEALIKCCMVPNGLKTLSL
jgi:hypothetical protein